ncbi:MAG TPA: gamma-glutamyl-gamma-aminobutyrate hydrolase family protein [Planctomycetota bacterium]|jgi:gamma-glutamyl-gamma-aminobutyrate hydrolase PuuD
MMRPVIGLNTSLMKMEDPLEARALCHLKYIDSVAAAGGVPVFIPPYTDLSMLQEALAKLDGFLLIGGPDYDPAHYGEKACQPGKVMHSRRDTFDLALAEALLRKTALPVLGICGGLQLINLHFGGALIQDLRSQWQPDAKHASTLLHADAERAGSQKGNAYRHELKLKPGSLLERIVGAPKLLTNSFHHQAACPNRIGKGLVPTAWAPDGVIEALELDFAHAPAPKGQESRAMSHERFLLAVQWHPERQTPDRPHAALFEALVKASK